MGKGKGKGKGKRQVRETAEGLERERLYRIGRHLSWCLRHSAVPKDQAGWVSTAVLLSTDKKLQSLGAEHADLVKVVAADEKGRFEITEAAIRAAYGWDEQIGVATEMALTEVTSRAELPADALYHGTTLSALEGILSEGLRPGCRLVEGGARMHDSDAQRGADQVRLGGSRLPQAGESLVVG